MQESHIGNICQWPGCRKTCDGGDTAMQHHLQKHNKEMALLLSTEPLTSRDNPEVNRHERWVSYWPGEEHCAAQGCKSMQRCGPDCAQDKRNDWASEETMARRLRARQKALAEERGEQGVQPDPAQFDKYLHQQPVHQSLQETVTEAASQAVFRAISQAVLPPASQPSLDDITPVIGEAVSQILSQYVSQSAPQPAEGAGPVGLQSFHQAAGPAYGAAGPSNYVPTEGSNQAAQVATTPGQGLNLFPSGDMTALDSNSFSGLNNGPGSTPASGTGSSPGFNSAVEDNSAGQEYNPIMFRTPMPYQYPSPANAFTLNANSGQGVRYGLEQAVPASAQQTNEMVDNPDVQIEWNSWVNI